ncbi:hypothetical protein F4820DRAFT_109268 [Hypoxylon rubiginosum]|uniref:Uncharacterized protein n=1 Tax=Hypoxylon rubiginosum TaxID=110542 RepID=A0ACB9YLY4_9PEZI|nr:hypothetical protein F4820DRAFT_109268 [Hypoxylon rubiginosum]
MSDYASLKVPELKKLLQEKSLPVTGNKADLIARLQEHDKSKAPPVQAEDEIDYSDDEVPTTTTKPVEPTKPAEPTDPAPPATEEKATESVEPAKDAAESAPLADEPVDAAAPEEKAEDEIPAVDFSAHLPASNADEETRKRAERAKRFGIVENEEEQKKSQRAERFGVEQSSLAKGLDAALPEKRPPKRGREGTNADGERGAKRQNPGGRQRGKGRFRSAGRPGGASRRDGKPNGPKGKSSFIDDPAEKAKAEARAKRFAGGS